MSSSTALIVRDAMLDRAKLMPFFAGFTFKTNKAFQVQPEHVPFCGIYFINEDLLPDGDPQDGEPRLHSMVLYGFSIIVQNNDADAAENKLDDLWVLLTNGLFTDPSLYLNPAAQIQSYSRGNRSHQFGSTAGDNSIPIAECRFTLTIDLGVWDWPPLVPDMLKTVHVRTEYPPGSDPNEVQQTEAEYVLETTRENRNESAAKKR